MPEVSSVVADIFREAVRLNAEDARREGNLIALDTACELLVCGDIHGNRRGLAKVIAHADLKANPRRHLVLQELTHGPPDPGTGHDRSVELLLRAARLKAALPNRLLFIMGNHDVAQLSGAEITKDGRGVCKAFADGVLFAFPNDGPEVFDAVRQFMRSCPLAVRCGGTMISHSLPSPSRMDEHSTEILTRPLTDEDLLRGGAAYNWTWGRKQTDEQLDELADRLGVEFFLLGHQHTDAGFTVLGPRAAVVVSDHNHGCVAQFGGETKLSGDTFERYVRPLAALGATV